MATYKQNEGALTVLFSERKMFGDLLCAITTLDPLHAICSRRCELALGRRSKRDKISSSKFHPNVNVKTRKI